MTYRISTVNPSTQMNRFRKIFVLKYKQVGEKTAILVYPMSLKFFRKNGFSRQVRSMMRHAHKEALKTLLSQEFSRKVKS